MGHIVSLRRIPLISLISCGRRKENREVTDNPQAAWVCPFHRDTVSLCRDRLSLLFFFVKVGYEEMTTVCHPKRVCCQDSA